MKLFKNYRVLFLLSLLSVSSISTLGAYENAGESISIEISNTSNIDKLSETIEITWKSIAKLNNLAANKIIVKEKKSGREIPSQVIFGGEKNPQSLIFQTNISAGEKQQFTISTGTRQKYEAKVYGRQVPERFDDFAWENDKVAFRMYGEALESQDGMAKGIDFWAKKTSRLVVNELYKGADYHHNHGDAVDAYHVGITLGSGDAEPIVGDSIIYPINYAESKILDQGPIRISFMLIYKSFKVNGKLVEETKTVSLDAGSQLNKIVNHYQTEHCLKIAAGVTKHNNDGIKKMDKDNSFVAYWDKADGDAINGFMGVGIVYPPKSIFNIKETEQHLLIIGNANENNNFTYYQGGCWNKSGNFDSEDSWFNYLARFSKNLKSPLSVKIN